MAVKEFEARTEKDAVRMACMTLLVEPSGLVYEVVDCPQTGRFPRVRIRVLETHLPSDIQSDAPPRGEGRERPRRPEGRERGRERAEPRGGGAGVREPAEATSAFAVKALQDIFARMGFEANVDVIETGDTVELVVDSPDTALLLEGEGETLESIQYLVSRIVNRGAPERLRVLVHIAGLKEQREEMLGAIARELAAKAKQTGKIVRVHPMSAADRRLVHQALTDVKGIETRSENAGPFRRLLVIPR